MNKKKQDRVFMAVTNDKYELPLALFETIREGANYAGMTRENFCQYVREQKVDMKNNCRYIRVDLSAKAV